MCRLGQGEAREWSAVARRSHRGADRADISFAFACVLRLPKMEVAGLWGSVSRVQGPSFFYSVPPTAGVGQRAGPKSKLMRDVTCLCRLDG